MRVIIKNTGSIGIQGLVNSSNMEVVWVRLQFLYSLRFNLRGYRQILLSIIDGQEIIPTKVQKAEKCFLAC